MANGKDQVDQNALAAEWGLSLDGEGAANANAAEGAVAGEGQEAAAQQWAASVDEAPSFGAGKSSAERVLSQEEIDGLLGFSVADVSLNDNSGIRAIIDFGDGLLRAPADAGNRLRPAGPVDDDIAAQFHFR